jgi:hypothetical protein
MKREPQSTVAKEAAGESEFRLASASLLPMAPQITFITTMISIQKIKQASSHNEEYIYTPSSSNVFLTHFRFVVFKVAKDSFKKIVCLFRSSSEVEHDSPCLIEL